MKTWWPKQACICGESWQLATTE